MEISSCKLYLPVLRDRSHTHAFFTFTPSRSIYSVLYYYQFIFILFPSSFLLWNAFLGFFLFCFFH
jgi:hypothetical protein